MIALEPTTSRTGTPRRTSREGGWDARESGFPQDREIRNPSCMAGSPWYRNFAMRNGMGSPLLRIQRVPQGVGEQVEGQHQREQGRRGGRELPPYAPAHQLQAGIVDHHAPAGEVLHAPAEI